MSAENLLKGGEFVIKASEFSTVFTPEKLTDEQRMIGGMTREFIDQKIVPNLDKIDKQEEGLSVRLIEECGELGLLGASIPAELGGMDLDFNSETAISAELGRAHSFSVSFAAHTGIGTLPILYFGNAAQHEKYIPKLATGEFKAAYCLTEPGSGSDALAAKTKAVLSDDGSHYVLNGQKMWITNAGFADVFVVFAQVDGDKFTGFIVERGFEGLNLGAEEDKMGIKGSSTRMVFLENAKVPVENVLGEIGKGHKIAFNILNIGRYKLGIMATSGAKSSINHAIKYANERIQFKVPISTFGAIQHKLAQMAINIYVSESACYRAGGLISEKVDQLIAGGMKKHEAKLAAAEEYSIECAMLKVLGSEVLDYNVDEAVQIFGGTGFSEEYPVARGYRDSRINRIFEGTNEINRMLSVGMLLKKAMKGELDVMGQAMAIQKELTSVPSFGGDEETGALAAEHKAIKNAKKAILAVAGAAVQKFMNKFDKEQEIMMNVADMLIETFAAESTILRTENLIASKGEEGAALEIAITKTYVSDTMERLNLYGKHAVTAFEEGDMLTMLLSALKRYTKYAPFNTTAARRSIATKLNDAGEYCF